MRSLDWQGAIRFVDATTEDAELCPVDRAVLLARFHARENGTILSGAAAFAAMWRAIPVLRPLGLLARLPKALFLMERAYIVFLRHRPRLQRLVVWGRSK